MAIIVSSCSRSKNFPKGKYFVFRNKIVIQSDSLSKSEKASLVSRLNTQFDDSSTVTIKDQYLIVHKIMNPPVYDTVYSDRTARNMQASLLHVGYYKANVTYSMDSSIKVRHIPSFKLGRGWFPYYKSVEHRITTTYTVDPKNPTRIDTMSYRLKRPDLQKLADSTIKQSFIVKNDPVSKANISADKARLVDLFRNNGYYKFTSDDLQMIGDTTIAALTTISDDPFENLRLLAEAQRKRNKPTIKLALVLSPGADTNRLKKYYINNVYIYPDYSVLGEESRRRTVEDTTDGYYIRHRKDLFDFEFLKSKMALRKGDVYKEENYSKTISNLTKTGIWSSISIQPQETKDSSGKLDMYVRLIPVRKYGFEANIEASYSTNNNYSLGNLLGLSGNVSLQERNKKKKGIKTTTALRAGVEFNVSKNKSTNSLINSNDVGLSRTISNPKLVWPYTTKNKWLLKTLKPQNKTAQQSFINASLSYTNRIDLFNLQSVGLVAGYSWTGPKNGNWTLKPLNVEFSRLYNQSQAFEDTLKRYPFLRYSFNTAMVLGSSASYSYNFKGKKVGRDNTIKFNLEESGYPALIPLPVLIPVADLGLFKSYIRRFAKFDIDLTMTTTYSKRSSFVKHIFLGIGVPFGDVDKTLPFFKQYFLGGANSMRGWPIRGIGPGKVSLKPYGTSSFNDRTGDLKFEANLEHRHIIASIIPNSIVLKGALFADIGNIWNMNYTKTDGSLDSAQISSFKNFYKQLGVAAGYGFRLDFNYFLIRFDLGFRIKRPDLETCDGWRLPSMGFDNVLRKLFSRKEKEWRYNNMNFTIGIGVPF
ncbi:BamA/TamA family outer membrane protein [Ferruginibacter sp. SUN002]|uniref:translocation and assembly module lipoprotein TamL n=1 Tax=Ferruginibacter sp. SUN002 TaxID=2937789 RepID=UPI003D35C8A2